jgi:hypothetical protein
MNFLRGRAIAQAVRQRPLTAEARVRARSIQARFVVDKVTLGQYFLRVLRFSRVNIIPRGLHTHMSWWLRSSETFSPHRHKHEQLSAFHANIVIRF